MRQSDLALTVESVPRVAFETFMQHFQWKQGQHLAMVGPTDSGKTTLALRLLPLQPYVTAFATKPADDTMDLLAGTGYKIFKRWPQSWPWNSVKRYPRRIIWPPINSMDKATQDRQKERFTEAMGAIYGEGGWCLYLDELYTISEQLGMKSEVKFFLTQARSLKISLAVGTQRPFWVPLEVYDQSQHLFFFRDNDERNLSRIGGISWRSADLIRKIIANLDPHEFLYVYTPKGGLIRSQVGRNRT